MRIHYKNPLVGHLASRWEAFQEEARMLTGYLQRFGFYLDRVNYLKVPDSDSWKFSAFFRNSKRIIPPLLYHPAASGGSGVVFHLPDLGSTECQGHQPVQVLTYPLWNGQSQIPVSQSLSGQLL